MKDFMRPGASVFKFPTVSVEKTLLWEDFVGPGGMTTKTMTLFSSLEAV